jgi:hypothetical protein
MVKSSRPNAPSTWLVFLCPRTQLPCRTCLYSATSILAVHISCCVVAVFVFRKPLFITKLLYLCLLHEYNVIYSIQCYPQFHVTALGLGTYYLEIQGHTCICNRTQAFWDVTLCHRCMVPDVTKGHCFIIIRHEAVFMLKAPCFYVTSNTTGPVTKCFTQKTNYTSQDFVPRKVYCVSNVTFHAESKYAIKIFPSPTVLYNGIFYYWFFEILAIQWFFCTWTNILNCFEHRVVTYSLLLSNH